MKTSTMVWIGAGLAAAGAAFFFLTRKTCGRCQELARQGEFDEIASTFEEVCEECVEVAAENAIPALDVKLRACNENPTPECREELAQYWHNLFLMAQKAGKTQEVGQNLINLKAASDPTLARYESSGYTVAI